MVSIVQEGLYGVYAEVAHYRDWIDSTINGGNKRAAVCKNAEGEEAHEPVIKNNNYINNNNISIANTDIARLPEELHITEKAAGLKISRFLKSLTQRTFSSLHRR